MKRSPLELESSVVIRLFVEAHAPSPDKLAGKAPSSPQGHANLSTQAESQIVDAELRRWRVPLALRLEATDDGASPYTLDVGTIGLFPILEGYPPEQDKELVHVNGASVLLGAVRELVALVKSRGPRGIFKTAERML